MGRITLLLSVVLLSGCMSWLNPPKPVFVKQIEIQEVDVPIIVRPPSPPVLTRPELPVYDLREEDIEQPGVVVQRYRATVKALLGYTAELEAIINGYRYK